MCRCGVVAVVALRSDGTIACYYDAAVAMQRWLRYSVAMAVLLLATL
jgi:hypothetical protein